MTNPLDNWEWIYSFFRSTIELDNPKATKAANCLTGESRPEPDENEVIARLKPLMGQIHDEVCDCENSKSHHN